MPHRDLRCLDLIRSRDPLRFSLQKLASIKNSIVDPNPLDCQLTSLLFYHYDPAVSAIMSNGDTAQVNESAFNSNTLSSTEIHNGEHQDESQTASE